MHGVLLYFVLCQQTADPVRSSEVASMMARARDVAAKTASQSADAQTQRDFAERFNRLVSALKAFEEAYSSNQGQVWPAKQAATLDLAMRELSKSPGWRQKD